MEEIENLIEQLTKFRSDETSTDFFKAEIYLRQYGEELEKQHDKRVRDLQHRQDREGTLCKVIPITDLKPELPILFDIDNRPVKELYLFNIHYKLNRDKLTEFLKSHGINEFTLTAVEFSRTKSTSAKLHCNNLATSCLVQIFSILKKLTWKFYSENKKKTFTGSARVRAEAGQKPVPSKIKKNYYKHFERSELFRKIWYMTEIANHIYKFLEPKDQANFYLASYKHPSFLGFIAKKQLDTSWPLFTGLQAISELRNVITQVVPRRIHFSFPHEPNVVFKTLEIFANSFIQESKTPFLECLDLRGINVTTSIIEQISVKIHVRELKIAETQEKVFENLKTKETEILTIYKNTFFTAKHITIEIFDKLVKLEIIKCDRLFFETISNFVSSSKSLKEIKLVDCYAIDRDLFLARLLESIFSKDVKITKFTFSFTEVKSTETTVYYQPCLQKQPYLTHLDIENNADLSFLTPKMVECATNICYVNLLGLSAQNINFENSRKLYTVKLSYFHDITSVIETIKVRNYLNLTVINSLGKKKTKMFNMEALKDLINSLRGFDMKFQKCKMVKLPDWVLKLEKEEKITIIGQDQTLLLKKGIRI